MYVSAGDHKGQQRGMCGTSRQHCDWTSQGTQEGIPELRLLCKSTVYVFFVIFLHDYLSLVILHVLRTSKIFISTWLCTCI